MITPVSDEVLRRLDGEVIDAIDPDDLHRVVAEIRALRVVADAAVKYRTGDAPWMDVVAALRDAGRLP